MPTESTTTRRYFVNEATGESRSVPYAGTNADDHWDSMLTRRGFILVDHAAWKQFRKEHAGPRAVTIYIDDKLHTQLRSAVTILRNTHNDSSLTIASLITRVVESYVHQRVNGKE